MRGVSPLKMRILEIARSFRPPFFLSFTKILSESPLLASIRCLVDQFDDIRGHGKIIIDTLSYIPHHQSHFFLYMNTRPTRAKYSQNVVARRGLLVVGRSSPRLFFSKLLSSASPYLSPLHFIFLVPPAPFPSFYRL